MRLWLVLLALWLLLNQTLAPGQVLLGALLAFGGVLALRALQGSAAPMRHSAAIAQLLLLVLADVVRSNLAVARLVLYRGTRKRVAGFVHMPLALRHPAALAVLACIITATPGTSWARLDRSRNVLIIHVFDLIDEQQWMQAFKQRYETRLMEIFE
jgi:multicomponent K+:H+ antiporter subunit E